MFTGIIEDIGKVVKLNKDGGNLHITMASTIKDELKIDQSVAHNGVCLTVVDINEGSYTVTAIKETLDKTNLGLLSENDSVNIERAMKLGDRLDGHIVQGHVDQTAKCTSVEKEEGSWVFTFEYDKDLNNITIEKGSITVNGVSLTVVDSKLNSFSVAIIPYTYEHTTFKFLEKGDLVNLEFDVLGKYVKRLNELRF
ncbi:riboflavin synthase [Winogradskyella pulchriflava]|uniref:Riboflavin synthase n=1 Tax=Winogradskyella pulchriflava TaxID=1110688 RepID=A0ABV6Q5C7_9FLAO